MYSIRSVVPRPGASRICLLRSRFHTTPLKLHPDSPEKPPSSPSKPQMTQNHVTRKSKDPVHQDSDVQSASTRAAQDARSKAGSSESSGENEPFDAARQGNTGGQVKESSAQSEHKGDPISGSFKDQVGGQDERDKGPGVEAGGNEVASGMGLGETIKNSLGGVRDKYNVGFLHLIAKLRAS